MARTYAQISVHRQADEDWRALTWAQQGFYDFLLAHPKLSLCGVLDVKPTIWVRASGDGDPELLERLCVELEEARFVLWDRDTDELALRTFVRHDGVLKNRNLAKGMWSAWRSVESETLRDWLVDNFPEKAFDPQFDPPCEPPFRGVRNQCSDSGSNQGLGPVSELPNLSHPATYPASVSGSDRSSGVENRGVFLPGTGWVS